MQFLTIFFKIVSNIPSYNNWTTLLANKYKNMIYVYYSLIGEGVVIPETFFGLYLGPKGVFFENLSCNSFSMLDLISLAHYLPFSNSFVSMFINEHSFRLVTVYIYFRFTLLYITVLSDCSISDSLWIRFTLVSVLPLILFVLFMLWNQ